MPVNHQLLAVLLLSLVAASVAVWIGVLVRLRRGEAPIRYTPRRRAPWSIVEVLLTTGVYLVAVSAVRPVLESVYGVQLPDTLGKIVEQMPHLIAPLLVGNALASLVTVAIAVLVARARAGATWQDLGLRARGIGADLRLGVAAWLAALLPAYLIRVALQPWFPAEETLHPVIDMLQRHSGLATFLLAGMTAVLVAPVFEEFVFRVLLQGWAESALTPRGGHGRKQTPAAEPLETSAPADPSTAGGLVGPVTPPDELEPGVSNPYESPRIAGGRVQDAAQIDDPNDEPPPPWAAGVAILLSSLVFAMLHAGNWPDPIPLLPLAAIFGYVYYRTHRLLPCVIAHAVFNATALVAVWLAR
jgi:membrane protease YdiL (CAAX protease family)